MDKSYLFIGDETLGSYVDSLLQNAGFSQAQEVEGADFVLTYCCTLSDLEDAYFESEGLIKRTVPGTVLVDLSPSTPALAREISAVATVNDLTLVEAPLAIRDAFRPDAFGRRDNMMCYVAGEPEDREKALPLLDILVSEIFEVGASGSAQLAKSVNTINQASVVVSAVEANVLYQAFRQRGLTPEAEDAASSIFGKSFSAVNHIIAADDYANSFIVSMLLRDVAAAMSAADDAEIILPQLESALHILELIAVIGGAGKGLAALNLLYQDESESAAQGLDWSRAEGLYGQALEDEQFDYEDDEFDLSDGFGGYSTN